jgi:hypothetical protein
MSDFARDPAWLQRRYDECLRDIESIAAQLEALLPEQDVHELASSDRIVRRHGALAAKRRYPESRRFNARICAARDPRAVAPMT